MQQKLISLNENVCNINSYFILFIFACLHLQILYFNINIIFTAYLVLISAMALLIFIHMNNVKIIRILIMCLREFRPVIFCFCQTHMLYTMILDMFFGKGTD